MAAALFAAATAAPVAAQEDRSYYIYVASESADEVSLLRFIPGEGLWVEKVIAVGFWPAEMEGPHGINVGPGGTHWYLTLGHGFPFGSLLKYRAGVDTLEGRVELGLFPATLVVAPGGIALVVNANFHGDHTPSTVSVVDLATMTEIDRIETCTMPHGSRLSPDGTRHYSGCMMDDQLVEIDAVGIKGSRRLHVSSPGEVACSPTWAAPAPDGRFVYVPCNKRDEILEVDVAAWRIGRRWRSPRAPYNAEVTPNGRLLIVTQKGSGDVSVWDRSGGERVALIPSTRRVTHGVTISPDGRYAFVSAEGVGGEPGAVDVIDLAALGRVASVDVGKQAGGIIFWRMKTR